MTKNITKKTIMVGAITTVLVLTTGIYVIAGDNKEDDGEVKGVKEVVINQTTETTDSTNSVTPTETEESLEASTVIPDSDQESTQTEETPKPTQIRDYSYLTFDQAFAAAVRELGIGQTFIWGGAKYKAEYGDAVPDSGEREP